MLVMYCVLRDIFPKLHTHCIIDITGEATEFGIVENNLLIENISIPYGSNSFIAEIMEKTGKPVSDILTSIETYDDGTTTQSKDFEAEIEIYRNHIKDAMNRILERRMIPSNIIFTAHPPYDSFFKHVIEETINASLQKDATLMKVEYSLIDEVNETAQKDVYLALAARFFHKLHGCGELEVE